jgi:hypothetical protein
LQCFASRTSPAEATKQVSHNFIWNGITLLENQECLL